ncbi:MAG TPA: DUF1376 domain-containing protein [Nitrospinaceae bacterium]|nr:DUF1376 domain-containing protein [Nitrospinaceae bacterium]
MLKNKSPAFQFFPKDFLSDINVVLMSNQARGCYITLMSHEWEAQGNGITNKIEDIAKVCGENVEDMAMLWKSIEMCFKPHPKDSTKLIHPRLEKERKKQKDNRKKRASAGKKGAKARWEPDSNAIDLPMAKNSLSSSSSIASSTAVKKASGNKKPDNEKNEVTDTTKALRAWITEYENQIKEYPDFSPARDNSILKPLVKTHGLEKVLEKIPYHISERKMLNITGFKVRFNDLGVNTNQTRGAKKRLQIQRLMKEIDPKSGDIFDLVPERKS